MRYDGNTCDGCKELLQEDDDIVVCPECATPQHRKCYEEHGGCVNAHLHGEGFEWEGKVSKKTGILSSTLVNHKTDGEELICPNCKHPNRPGSTVCSNCSMKFTMFGVNIVEQAQKQEKLNGTGEEAAPHETELPPYEAPFSIGTGEGFENSEETAAEATPDERPEGTNPWNLGSYEDYEEINTFKGPFPVEDYTAGVRTNTLRSFIRGNAQSYINKFKWSEIRNGNGFNWAAFLFSPYWFFYRKLYKPGIIFMTLQFIMSIIITPILTPFMEFYSYTLTLDPQTISDAMLNELTDKMTVMLDELMLPLTIMAAVTFIMHLISGFIANGMYKKYCVSNIKEALSKGNVHEKIRHFAKFGGSSFLLVFAAYFAETLLNMLVSYLLN